MRSGQNKNLFNNKIIAFTVLLVLFRPVSFLKISMLDIVINILRIMITVGFAIRYIIGKKYAKYVVQIALFWLLYNVICVMQATWTFSVLIETALAICVVLVVDTYFNGHVKTLYIALERLLLFYGLANFLTILLGFSVDNLFLGLDNDAAMIVIPMLGVLLYLSKVVNGRIRRIDYAIFYFHMLQYFITWSVAALISFVCFWGLINIKKIKFNYFTSPKIIIYSILTWCGLYYLRIQRLMAWFFEIVLGRDQTISYRLYIWKSSLNALSVRWLFGYGNYSMNEEYHRMTRKILPYLIVSSPHNFWLYICLCGGVVWMLLLIVLILHSYKSVDLECSVSQNRMLLSSLFAYMFCGVAASFYGLEYLFFLLAVCFFSNEISISSRLA